MQIKKVLDSFVDLILGMGNAPTTPQNIMMYL